MAVLRDSNAPCICFRSSSSSCRWDFDWISRFRCTRKKNTKKNSIFQNLESPTPNISIICRDIRVTPSIWCTKIFLGFLTLPLQGIILSLDPPTPRAPSHDLLHPLNVPWHCCHDVSVPDCADHVPWGRQLRARAGRRELSQKFSKSFFLWGNLNMNPNEYLWEEKTGSFPYSIHSWHLWQFLMALVLPASEWTTEAPNSRWVFKSVSQSLKILGSRNPLRYLRCPTKD